ncbi:hypothetical protein ANABIO32_34690 [Rossellomorea marisflavi]|uniref:phage tail domain-containing protein n=1 Tax=Rossellomorea marisflavi TaxID=189381 RepID=UPI0025C807A1|nr:phage tail domain-containing protein [Rossellomorea marisflavi]GLI85720.1 hypothetical protein ANABIO32_34690 [Rossellomorea marisflavi]
MIRESLYFSFAGRKSTDFPIVNVSIGSGLYEEALTSSKSIIETSTPGNNVPYFQRVKREPKTFPIRFAFLEPWNDEMIDDIIRWLDTDYYEPLFFSSNIDRVFYAMTTDTISQIHNGLKQGYVDLNIRCNGAYSYSNDITTPIYDVKSTQRIRIVNDGHESTFPEISIQKIGDGSVSIKNYNNNQTLEVSNLKDKEELTIDCLTRQIESNLPGIHRYDDFNDEYLELVYGTNNIVITGGCRLVFKYNYIFK